MADVTGAVFAEVEIEGHIIDSLVLPRVFDRIIEVGGDYEVLDVRIGKTSLDTSYARLKLSASSQPALDALLAELRVHGVNALLEEDCHTEPAPADGVLPEGFYASTNLPTQVRVGGTWLAVEPSEMDCAVVVAGTPGGEQGEQAAQRPSAATTVPMADVAAGAAVVVGTAGVRVSALDVVRDDTPFAFMTSDVSSEKPKGQLLDRVAARVRACIDRGGRVLAVVGPAVVHTGASPHLARLVRAGFVHVLFAGNGFATHDIESDLYGTSLGVPVKSGDGGHEGHANHLRTINRVRAWGSIAAGVESGELQAGTMYECVRAGVPFVLGGSLRDDGPLPDVTTDVIEAQRQMRGHLPGIEVALMLGSTLHAIATGNLLPATVETFCVDINPAVVTKLADRGTHQALGIVTDVGLFVRELEGLLCPPS